MKALPWIALVLAAGFLLVRQNAARDLATRVTTLESRVVAAERMRAATAAGSPG
ncbi:MAG: hypothetical protein HKN82_19380, partial [Akkermansiaceae bacterium]|nr:hypothetical protein [Akkermansiaceae bacterium]